MAQAQARERLIVEALYAPLSGQGILEHALDLLREHAEADNVVLRFVDAKAGIAHATNAVKSINTRYELEYLENPLLQVDELGIFRRLLRRSASPFVQVTALPGYQNTMLGDFSRQHRVGNLAGAYLFDWRGLRGRLGIHRHGRPIPHSPENVASVERILPHLKAAYLSRVRLDELSASPAVPRALDRVPLGAALLDAGLCVRYLNQRAEDLLGGQCGLALENGKLVAQASAENARLQDVLRRTALTGCGLGFSAGGSVRIATWASTPPVAGNRKSALAGSQRALWLLASPLVAAAIGSGRGIASFSDSTARRPCVLLLFREERNDLPAALPESLRRLYGLTASEASLACALAAGGSPQEYSAFLGVSIHTTRNHLRRIFRKMDVSGQSELVRTVLAGTVNWLA